MIYLVMGTPDSGKSAVAEELAVRTKDPHKIYLATMKVLDEAGRKAADKAMKLLEEVGVDVTLLKIRGAKDPDEFIRNSGPEAFQKVLEGFAANFTRRCTLGRNSRIFSDFACRPITHEYLTTEAGY